MKQFFFEKLEVWQKSKLFVVQIYDLTASFPHDEKFGLTSQIRRAAVSISSNIAEGTSRITGKEQARFTEIAFSSLMEVLSQLHIAVELKYTSYKKLEELKPVIVEIANKLNGLRKSQLNRNK